MKILLVTPSYYPIVGGSEVLTKILSIMLNKLRIRTDIMTFNMDKKWYPRMKTETEEEGAVRIHRIAALNPFKGHPSYFDSLLKINVFPVPRFVGKMKEYDVIHYVGEADLSVPLLSCFIRKPKIMHCVGIFKGGIYKYYAWKRPILGSIFRRFFPNLADTYIVSSDEEANILSDLGVPEGKITILPIGVDTSTFQPDETRRQTNLVLFVGRIERDKGLHLAIEALSHVDAPVHLIIIGSRWDREYVEEIEKMSKEVNGRGIHKVEFLGIMNQTKLVSWYQKAALVVCPYLVETFSNVTREALACGTPVVSTGKHILEHGSDGIIVVPKNPSKIAEAIEKLLRNGQLRRQLGAEGRRLILQRFSWQSIIKQLIRIYLEMMRNQQG